MTRAPRPRREPCMVPMSRPRRHLPVLLSEVLESSGAEDGETYIDGTFGAGGYTRAILGAANCNVLALDRDPRAIRDAAALMREAIADRLTLVEAPFSEMEDRRAGRARR